MKLFIGIIVTLTSLLISSVILGCTLNVSNESLSLKCGSNSYIKFMRILCDGSEIATASLNTSNKWEFHSIFIFKMFLLFTIPCLICLHRNLNKLT